MILHVHTEMTVCPNIKRVSEALRRYLQQGVQYVAPGPDGKDANVYFLPQKNSNDLKFALQFTVTFN